MHTIKSGYTNNNYSLALLQYVLKQNNIITDIEIIILHMYFEHEYHQIKLLINGSNVLDIIVKNSNGTLAINKNILFETDIIDFEEQMLVQEYKLLIPLKNNIGKFANPCGSYFLKRFINYINNLVKRLNTNGSHFVNIIKYDEYLSANLNFFNKMHLSEFGTVITEINKNNSSIYTGPSLKEKLLNVKKAKLLLIITICCVENYKGIGQHFIIPTININEIIKYL